MLGLKIFNNYVNVIGGNCIIGNKVLIGSNATILQNLKIDII